MHPQIGKLPIRLAGVGTLLALGMLLLVGCSASNSSETLSDSISSPFKWSSGSADSSSDGGSAYRQDVSDYTVAFARSSALGSSPASGGVAATELDAFRSGIRRLAEQRGVSNWEDDAFTLASIGLGLRSARLDEASALAFGAELLGDDARALDALRAGYASIP